jgi:hypothetical protein
MGVYYSKHTSANCEIFSLYVLRIWSLLWMTLTDISDLRSFGN